MQNKFNCSVELICTIMFSLDLESLVQLPSSSVKANTALSPLSPKEVSPECMRKNYIQTDAKESSKTLNEQSWMEMALEQTRSLHQLFSSRLNEFTGLENTTKPAACSETQKSSSLPSARPMGHISVEQSSMIPICTQPPNVQSLAKATASVTPTALSTCDSERDIVLVKHLHSTSIQQQTVQLCARPGTHEGTCITTTKFNTSYGAKDQLSQMPVSPTHSIQQSLQRRMAKLQTLEYNLHVGHPSCLHLSANSERMSYQHSQLSSSQILPQMEWFARDQTYMYLQKSSVENEVQRAGMSPSEQRHNQRHYTEKVMFSPF